MSILQCWPLFACMYTAIHHSIAEWQLLFQMGMLPYSHSVMLRLESVVRRHRRVSVCLIYQTSMYIYVDAGMHTHTHTHTLYARTGRSLDTGLQQMKCVECSKGHAILITFFGELRRQYLCFRTYTTASHACTRMCGGWRREDFAKRGRCSNGCRNPEANVTWQVSNG